MTDTPTATDDQPQTDPREAKIAAVLAVVSAQYTPLAAQGQIGLMSGSALTAILMAGHHAMLRAMSGVDEHELPTGEEVYGAAVEPQDEAAPAPVDATGAPVPQLPAAGPATTDQPPASPPVSSDMSSSSDELLPADPSNSGVTQDDPQPLISASDGVGSPDTTAVSGDLEKMVADVAAGNVADLKADGAQLDADMSKLG